MKRLLIVISALLLSCASAPAQTQKTVPKASEILSCENPEGYEYICYSDRECREYHAGYSAVVRERFEGQKDGFYTDQGDYQVIHMNLFYDHRQYSIIGRIEAEKKEDGRIYIRIWTIVCDVEWNLLDEGYSEGYRQ